jgi:hypothetical protein
MVDGRLGSRLRGYRPVAPRPISCTPSVPPVISRGAPRQATWETSVNEGRNYGREMAGQFRLWFRLSRKSQGSLTRRKSATSDRRLYFPSEGRHAVDFFARKIPTASAGFEPAILGNRWHTLTLVERKHEVQILQRNFFKKKTFQLWYRIRMLRLFCRQCLHISSLWALAFHYRYIACIYMWCVSRSTIWREYILSVITGNTVSEY